MAKLMNIGFGNMVNTDKIVCIVSSDSAPAKRMVAKRQRTGKSDRCDTGTQDQKRHFYRKQQNHFISIAAGDACRQI